MLRLESHQTIPHSPEKIIFFTTAPVLLPSCMALSLRERIKRDGRNLGRGILKVDVREYSAKCFEDSSISSVWGGLGLHKSHDRPRAYAILR